MQVVVVVEGTDNALSAYGMAGPSTAEKRYDAKRNTRRLVQGTTKRV